MAERFANNSFSTLAGALTAVATSCSVAAGTGLKFPPAGSGDTFKCVIVSSATGDKEVIRVDARTTDSFGTIARAVEAIDGAQVARAFVDGDAIYASPSAAFLEAVTTKVAIQDGSTVYAAGAGTADALTITLAPVPVAYVGGEEIRFKPSADNTGSATIDKNGVGAKTIKKSVNGALVDLVAGDLRSTHVHRAIYVPTEDVYLLINPAARKVPTRTLLTSTQTYTPPVGLLYINVRMQAPGGGGGGAKGTSSQLGAAGGGGGGEYAEKLILASALGATESYVHGAPGVGGATGDNAGTAGSDSNLGAHVSAEGGDGGAGSDDVGAANIENAGGAGGNSGTGADFQIDGESGGDGYVALNSPTAMHLSGNGGGSFMGNGGTQRVLSHTGDDGSGYGGGGSGASTNSKTDRAGGGGSIGITIIDEIYA